MANSYISEEAVYFVKNCLPNQRHLFSVAGMVQLIRERGDGNLSGTLISTRRPKIVTSSLP